MAFVPENNFCRVFELPERYPDEYCFGGGVLVHMKMVDWFEPWPKVSIHGFIDNEPETWSEVVDILLPFLRQKVYVQEGRKYLLVTEFGEAIIFGKHDDPTD